MEELPVKTECAAIIKRLTDEFKVPYLQIVEHLFKPYGGAHMFDQVPEDKLTELSINLKEWLEAVDTIDSSMNTLLEIDDATGGEHNLTTGVKNILSGTNAGLVKYDQLSPTVEAITKFATDWSTWFESTKQ